MKETNKNRALRLLRKLRKRIAPFTSKPGKLTMPMDSSIDFVNSLILEIHDKPMDYDISKDEKLQCNEIWNECIMRENC
tara:strand:- start:1299 stop:1535 length:237 start_codon:yes stop_codon:yes gene_type:complete